MVVVLWVIDCLFAYAMLNPLYVLMAGAAGWMGAGFSRRVCRGHSP